MNNLVDISINYIDNPLEIISDEFITTIDLNNSSASITNIENSFSYSEIYTPEIYITEVTEICPSTSDLTLFISGDIPQGLIDGINSLFITNFNFIPESVEVYLNGVRQKLIDDYQTIGNNNIQFLISPTIGESILIDYIKG